MALFKEISTNYGTTASYWKITSLVFNHNKDCLIVIYGYASKDARDNNGQALRIFEYTIPAVEVTDPFTLQSAYDYVKTQPDFSFNTIDI
jgi:hypothetical protein